jgi:hypothetical protein
MSPFEFTNVLVAVDGSEGGDKALDCALSICEAVATRARVSSAGGWRGCP